MTPMRWLLSLVFLTVAAGPLGADETAPATPAVPGGGNEHAVSPNAATPAVPADPARPSMREEDDETGVMTNRERGELAGGRRELYEQAKARWDAMTSEEREAFLAEHPKAARRMARLSRRNWDELSRTDRGLALGHHPQLKALMHDMWKTMSSDERRQFMRDHPRFARRVERRAERRERLEGRGQERRERVREGRPAHEDRGVRDRGRGEGRDGVGQGGERRNREHGGPKERRTERRAP